MTTGSSFPERGVKLLAALAKNNTRGWFTERKDEFDEHVKAPMAALVERIDAELEGFAPEYVTPPAKAIPRLHRDVRFSADKSPYKTEIAAIFPCRGREKQAAAGYYVGISGRGAELVAGAYMPDAPALAALRAHVATRHAQVRTLTGDAALRRLFGELKGESLVRVPKGFPPDHPAADLLRLKQWYFGCSLPRDVVMSSRLLPEILSRFRAATPFVRFLDAGFGGARR